MANDTRGFTHWIDGVPFITGDSADGGGMKHWLDGVPFASDSSAGALQTIVTAAPVTSTAFFNPTVSSGSQTSIDYGPEMYVAYLKEIKRRRKKRESKPDSITAVAQEVEAIDELIEQSVPNDSATTPDLTPQYESFVAISLKLAEAQAKLAEYVATQNQERALATELQANQFKEQQLHVARQIQKMHEEEEAMLSMLLMHEDDEAMFYMLMMH